MKYTLDMIATSPPTVSDKQAYALYLELHMAGRDWLYYHNLSHHGVIELAETFINNHACIRSSYDAMYSPMPVDVFHVSTNIHGLLYSNGAVCTNTMDGLIELWIEEETVTLFNYPRPEALNKDGDTSV